MIRRIGIAALIVAVLSVLLLVLPMALACLPFIGVGGACGTIPIDNGYFIYLFVIVLLYAPPVLATIGIWLVIEMINFIRERFFV